jgi:hypothetical protein
MNRREILSGSLALAFVGTAPGVALAAPDLPLDERLLRLDRSLARIRSLRLGRLVREGLRRSGLRGSLFQDMACTMVTAEAFKACTEQEQADLCWRARLEAPVARHASDVAVLLTMMEGRRTDRRARRAQRRLLRSPTRMTRLIAVALNDRNARDDRELRRGLAGVARRSGELGTDEAIRHFDETALAAGTTREELAAEGRTPGDLAVGGLMLMLGGVGSVALGYVLVLIANAAWPLLLCLVGVVAFLGGLYMVYTAGVRSNDLARLEDHELDLYLALEGAPAFA